MKKWFLLLAVFVLYGGMAYYFLHGVLDAPGLITGGDWTVPLSPAQMKAFGKLGFYLWRDAEDFIGGMVPYNMYPIHFFFGTLGKLGVSGVPYVKAFLLVLFCVCGASVYTYCRFLKLSFFSSAVAGYFFMASPVVFDYSIMGWGFLVFSFAILPLALITYTKSVKQRDLRYSILTALIYAVAFFYGNQVLIWYPAVFLTLSFFLVRSKEEFWAAAKSFSLCVGILIVLNLCWEIPLWLYPNKIVSGSASGTDVPFGHRLSYSNFLRLWGALFDYQFEVSFPKFLAFVTFLPPLLAYSTLCARKKRVETLFWAVLTLFPVALYTLKDFYYHIPFTMLIRDFTRIICLSTIAYAVLIGIAIDTILSKFGESRQFFERKKVVQWAVRLIVVAVLVVNSIPFWMQELYGKQRQAMDFRMKNLEFPPEYYEAEKTYLKEDSLYKVLFFPLSTYVGLRNDKRFHGEFREFVDPFSYFSPVPGAVSRLMRWVPDTHLFLADTLRRLFKVESVSISNWLNMLGIKYVFVRPTMYDTLPTPSSDLILERLERDPSFEKKMHSGRLSVYENKQALHPIFTAGKPNIVWGNYRNLLEVISSLTGREKPNYFFPSSLTRQEWNVSENFKNMLLVNGNMRDAVLDILMEEGRHTGGKSKVMDLTREKSRFLSDGKKRVLKIKTAESANLEVWVFAAENFSKNDSVLFLDEVKTNPLPSRVRDGLRWKNLGRFSVPSGVHSLEIKGIDGLPPKNVSGWCVIQAAERLSLEQVFKQQKAAHLFYWEGKKKKPQNRDFRFYVPKEGVYKVSAQVSLAKNVDNKEKSNPKVLLYKHLKNGGVLRDVLEYSKKDPKNCKYKESWQNGVWKFDVFWDDFFDEYVIIRIPAKYIRIEGAPSVAGGPVNLREYPFLGVSYRVENKNIQTVQILCGIKTDLNSKEEFFLLPRTSFPARASETPDTFAIDLLRKAKETFPNAKDFYLTALEILPHKIWGADCSDRYKGWYGFQFYDLVLTNEFPVEIENTTFFDGLTGLWMFENSDGLNRVKDFNGIPWNVRKFSKVEEKSGLNPLEKSQIEFTLINYPFDSAKIRLGFADENLKDTFVRDMDAPVFNYKNNAKLLSVNLIQVLKTANVPENGEKRLKWVQILSPDQTESLWFYDVLSKYMQNCEISYPSSGQQDNSFARLKVDSENVSFNTNAAVLEKERYQAVHSSVSLDKGWHRFRYSRGGNLELDWVKFIPSESKEENPPKIRFERLSPVKYIIHVQNAFEPFSLIFSESFHEGWKAYHVPKELLGRERHSLLGIVSLSALRQYFDGSSRVEISGHYQANGFANGWRINPENFNTGKENQEYDFVIEFYPQVFYEIGLFAAALTLIACVLYLILSFFRKTK